jgi:flagellum-specific peptidoglycan hydrolase FlgJ
VRKNEKTKKTNTLHSLMPVSAGVIASILIALNPSETVIASEDVTDETIVEIESLHGAVHSFLSELENQVGKEEEGLEEKETEDEVSTAPLVSEYDEMTSIKNILLKAISHVETDEYAAGLSAEDLTIPELEEILNELVIKVVEKEESIASEKDASTDLIAEVEEVEEMTEEENLDVTEDSVEPETSNKPAHREETENTDKLEEPQENEAVGWQKESTKSKANETVKKAPVATATFSTTRAPSTQLSTTSQDAKTIVHTVKAGETLNSIAHRYNVSVNEIVSTNNIINKNIIKVGQKLTIRTDQPGQADLQEINTKLTSNEFIDVIGSHAQKVAADHNLYASVMIAQAALESGFGGSSLSSAPNHNLFGIKGSYNGQSVKMRTREYFNGWTYVYADFKKYPSYTESLLDNARLLRNGLSWDRNYYSGTWRENANSYKDATSWLEGRYATDPTYASKLNNIIYLYDLTRFDVPYNEPIVEAPPVEENKDVTPSNSEK